MKTRTRAGSDANRNICEISVRVAAVAACLLAAALASGCGPDCATSGLDVLRVELKPVKACIKTEHTNPEDVNCVSEEFTIQNDCSQDLVLDLSNAPFKAASGGGTVKASGGRASFYIDFGNKTLKDGVYTIPAKLGAEAIEVAVNLSSWT